MLLCIPGFVLAGNLMNGGGITDQIVRFGNAVVGHVRGGLGLANVVGSMIFAGISGTAVAETASIGAVMIPAMRKSGYRRALRGGPDGGGLHGGSHHSAERADDHRRHPARASRSARCFSPARFRAC